MSAFDPERTLDPRLATRPEAGTLSTCPTGSAGELMKSALSLALLGLVGCATTSKSSATDETVLADARSRSAAYCAKYEDGCEVRVRRSDDGGWTASVVPVFQDAEGRRFVGIDLEDFYIYDDRGRFKSALRGY